MSVHPTLRLIHVLYAAFMVVSTWMWRHKRRQPNHLKACRSKVPKHLCLNLVANHDMPAEKTETAFLQCLQSVAVWCRVLGIETLTVYDRHGILYECSKDTHQRVFVTDETLEDSSESEVEYPLTPPTSEPSRSRCHTPESAMLPAELNVITMTHMSHLRRRRNVAIRRQSKSIPSTSSNLVIYIASRASGKPAIVSASRLLLQDYVRGASMMNDEPSGIQYKLTVSELATMLEAGLPPPDFMIIHHIGGMKAPYPPMEFYGFPPWQNTLTEFHRTRADDTIGSATSRFESLATPRLISETAFCRALDEYAGAEFRLGR